MKSSFLCAMIFLAASIFGTGSSGFGQQPTSTTVVGREGGSPFSDLKARYRGRVSEVYVFSGDAVCAVQMQFTLSDGRNVMGPWHGGRTDCQQNTFSLEPDEYIVGLSGRYDTHLDSLRIHTNKRTSSLFGGSGGSQDYHIDVTPGNQAIGFIGRSGRYLNAIGLTFVPLTIPQAGKTVIVGGPGGTTFLDPDIPMGAKISEVRIRSGNTIDAIQAVYTLQDGSIVEGPVHGGEGGSLSMFHLDSNEYITGFSGRSGNHIDSLSIRTNKRISQVFGGPGGGGIFNINAPAGNQVIGFAGRSSSYLDAIGLIYAVVDTRGRRGNPTGTRR